MTSLLLLIGNSRNQTFSIYIGPTFQGHEQVMKLKIQTFGSEKLKHKFWRNVWLDIKTHHSQATTSAGSRKPSRHHCHRQMTCCHETVCGISCRVPHHWTTRCSRETVLSCASSALSLSSTTRWDAGANWDCLRGMLGVLGERTARLWRQGDLGQ